MLPLTKEAPPPTPHLVGKHCMRHEGIGVKGRQVDQADDGMQPQRAAEVLARQQVNQAACRESRRGMWGVGRAPGCSKASGANLQRTRLGVPGRWALSAGGLAWLP